MPFLSVAEASRKYNIPENTLRYWIEIGTLKMERELRGRREVKVISEETLLLKIYSKDSKESVTDDSEDGGQPATSLEVIKRFQDQITKLQTENSELQYLRGTLEQKVQSLEDKLGEQERTIEAKDRQIDAWKSAYEQEVTEVQEWKRVGNALNAMLNYQRQPLWKRLLGLSRKPDIII